MVGAIQTFGQLIHWHSHIHALVSEGVFLPESRFMPLPPPANEPFLKLWEPAVFGLLLAGPKRNFQVFDALDFLAEVTQQIPDPGKHLICYYGWYSNKSRVLRA